MLNPEDLKKKTFTKGFRGYEVEEVDKFLAKLIKEYEYLYLDNLSRRKLSSASAPNWNIISRWRLPCRAPWLWRRKLLTR